MSYSIPRRRKDVADLAGVGIDQVKPLTAAQIRPLLHARGVDKDVIEVATGGDPAYYWQVGEGEDTRFYWDAADFGDVVDFADLRYDSTLGLHKVRKPKN